MEEIEEELVEEKEEVSPFEILADEEEEVSPFEISADEEEEEEEETTVLFESVIEG